MRMRTLRCARYLFRRRARTLARDLDCQLVIPHALGAGAQWQLLLLCRHRTMPACAPLLRHYICVAHDAVLFAARNALTNALTRAV